MATIVRLPLEMPLAWTELCGRAAVWAQTGDVDLRSAVMLVPFAQHLGPARKAWAQRGGWQPRVETSQTLAVSLAPPIRPDDGQVTLDASADRLNAAGMLRSQSWVHKEPVAFDAAVAAVVSTAHALVKAAAAVDASARTLHWQLGRELLSKPGGPDASERALARLALEWAALAPPRPTDPLFAHVPSAWIVVQACGGDALVERLLSAASPALPCLVLDTDAPAQAAIADKLTLASCDGFEHEAECAAAQVLAHLQEGATPVALVAQDRVLVRRVRALLERQQVSLLDETGWKLSTTRAAARVMSLLRAASPVAATDLLLDWLKSGPWPQAARAREDLEAVCRRHGWNRASSIDFARLSAGAAVLQADALKVLAAFTQAGRRPLSSWLSSLQTALQDCDVFPALAADEAGGQVLHALRLNDAVIWFGQAAQVSMSLDDFSAWVDTTLEDASFVPAAPTEQPSVVITPLSRVMLRPFAAIVFPGADDHHLGANQAPLPLLTEPQALALGLPTSGQRRESEALAFAHAVSAGPVALFFRRSEGAEPLAASPLVERLALRLRRAGRSFAPWVDPRQSLVVTRAPFGVPAPQAAGLLPPRLSASACEALRACPYRFHALHLLRLREADELDDEVEKRDYGTWLHAVLMKFHQQRGQPDTLEAESTRLMQVARQEMVAQGLAEADFLPYEDGFSELAPRYIAWLHQRDDQGARWWQGEQERQVSPPEWHGISLYGRIDRLDRLRREQDAATIELIDYKTGSAGALREKLKQPLEDTQLAFYAALMPAEAGVPLQAIYLALGRKIETIVHPDVEGSARTLVEGLAHDLARIRGGAGLPALGEGAVCEYCEARGLCRRDHWSAP